MQENEEDRPEPMLKPDPIDERSDFVCIECGEELGADDTCENEECPLYGASDKQLGY